MRDKVALGLDQCVKGVYMLRLDNVMRLVTQYLLFSVQFGSLQYVVLCRFGCQMPVYSSHL